MDEGADTTHPDLVLSLNIQAKEDLTVSLSSADSSVAQVPASVVVSAGEKTVLIPVEGVKAVPQPVAITASLDDDDLKAWVRVLDPDRIPTLSPIEPDSISIYNGKSKDVIVQLEVPAPENGATVEASISGTGFTIAPASVSVPAWETEASFSLNAQSGTGGGEVSFETAISKATLTVSLSDMPLLGVVISELLHNPDGSDDQQEWVEIYNGTNDEIDLSGYSIGYSDGGKVDEGYAAHTYSLSGLVPAGGCVVVGGPATLPANASPTYLHTGDFDPDIQNSSKGCALGLFDKEASQIQSNTVPLDALIYGDNNARGFMNADGNIPAEADVLSAPSGNTLERTLDGWQFQEEPNPGLCSF